MKHRILLGYQILTGLSDGGTGLLLVFAPALTLRLMKLHVAPEAMPFLSYVGVFVLSVGIACVYGATVIDRPEKIEVVWLLTALTRALIAAFVLAKIASGILEPGWITVAITDALFASIQAVGLAKGWLRHVER